MFAPSWLDNRHEICACVGDVKSPPDAKVIRLVASESFGTGGHPSTVALLEKFDGYRKKHILDELRILDFGAGSGIFSFYVKVKNYLDVVVAAVNPADIKTIEANRGLNEPIERAAVAEAFIGECRAGHWDNYFDIVGSHTGSRDSVMRAPLLHRVSSPSGFLIFSGHAVEDHSFVVHRLAEFFDILETDVVWGWPVIVGRPIPSKKRKNI